MTSVNTSLQTYGRATVNTGVLPELGASATPTTSSGSAVGEAIRSTATIMTHTPVPAIGALGGAIAGGWLARAATTAGEATRWSALRGGVVGLAAITAGVLGVELLRQRASSPAQAPTHVSPASSPHDGAPEHARVMTFNIRYGLGPTGYVPTKADMDAVAATIEREHPDIVMLQEVHDFGLDTALVNQFTSLTSRLHPDAAIFSPAGRDAIGKSDGNVIMTFHGYTIDDARSLTFTRGEGEQARGAAEADVVTPSGQHVRVVTTHLEGGGAALRQYGELGGVLARDSAVPTIVSGDWNARATRTQGATERKVLGGLGLVDAFTARGIALDDPARSSYGSGEPIGIDRILTNSPIAVNDVRVVRESQPSSDHQPVVADLTIGVSRRT